MALVHAYPLGMKSGDIQSVALTFSLIEALAREGKPLGVTQLSERVGAQKTRVFRHLRTLLELGYVRQNAKTERYHLGIKLFVLCRGLADQFQLGKLARPALQQLSSATRHTAVLSDSAPLDILRVVEVCRPNILVAASVTPGFELDLLRSAQGRIALAFGTRQLRERLSRRLHGPDQKMNEDMSRIIETARANGWATAPGVAKPGFNVLAAPVLDHAGKLAGTVGIVGSLDSIPQLPDPALIAAVKEAAASISALLGSDTTQPG